MANINKYKLRRDVGKLKRDLKVKKKAKNGYKAQSRARILYPGVGALPRRNFGSAICSRANLKALDARIPRTLGLPRAVGPYSIIRTSAVITDIDSNAYTYIFSPFLRRAPPTGGGFAESAWTSWCGVRQNAANSTNISASGGMTPLLFPTFDLGQAAEVCPASMTVQVVNSSSLQTAKGTFLMARCNQGLALGGTTSKTWADFRLQFTSYFNPRVLAAGKLALRGVKADAYPLNMKEYCDFSPVFNVIGADTWTPDYEPAALSPIVFVRNQAPETEANITFLVTMEWRVRFDPENPAVASQTHHDTMSDEAWNAVIKAASSMGHGVEELTEDVAEAGAIGLGARMALPLLA